MHACPCDGFVVLVFKIPSCVVYGCILEPNER